MHQIMVVDRSGRGHAWADLFSRTRRDVLVYYSPGCPAIETDRVVSLPQFSLADAPPMAQFARDEELDFVLVANTRALATGFVDAFRECGVPVIGPSRVASRLETSKSYTKDLCRRYGIRTPKAEWFDDSSRAIEHVRRADHQVVVKADGLCGGSGSFVCDSPDDAAAAIEKVMVDRAFGDSGNRVVVEERLVGRELSFFAILDGDSAAPLPTAMDYKRSDDGNRGILCGGMGSVSPHPMEEAKLTEMVNAQVLTPLRKCLRSEGIEYMGVIYLGCMLVGEQVYLLEINVRMGDPEAEAVLPRIETDFYALCQAVLKRQLTRHRIEDNGRFYCNVVATQGKTREAPDDGTGEWYPGWPYGRHGRYYPISGLENIDASRCRVFLGEAIQHPEKGLVTDGGQVVHVVGVGDTHGEAVANAYDAVGHVRFEGVRYRSDIGRLMSWETGPTFPASEAHKREIGTDVQAGSG